MMKPQPLQQSLLTLRVRTLVPFAIGVGLMTPRAGLGIAALLASVSLAGTASAKPFIEYIKPAPTVAPLSSATWGVAGVIPRDLSNGIESAMGAGVHPQWYYWDGEIIAAKDGKYHMFMSTFDANSNFGTAWQGSDAYHAISQTNVLGPYLRQDFVYTNNGSHKGHNVSAVELPDGTYAVIVSEIVPFQIFKSSSLDGPWTGCSPQTDIGGSNISMFPRHDGKYQIIERHGTIAISDTLCGHYVKKTPTLAYTASTDAAGTIYPKRTSIPGVSNPAFTWQEDPHIWRSGGTYHVIYSGSGDRVGWHLYSSDGLSWKDNGYAWSPRDYQKIFCYEGSTHCDAWYKMERPGVVLQDGHPTHITWAVADVDKDNQVTPGTNHGTKVVVVPFDGVSFDNDFGVGGGGGSGAGGASSTGGVSSTGGGASAAAGRSATGGSAAGGKSATSGGNSAMGGSVATGGANAPGGTKATGGSTSTGSAQTTGGKASDSTTGGTSTANTTGGRIATGGSSSVAGGVPGNGGTTGVGGQPSAGGALAAGGAHQSGGSTGTPPATGGATGTNDASNSDGCSCRVAGDLSPSKSLSLAGLLGLIVLRSLRRRPNRQVQNDTR
ncbi:MAG TPA: MYXO-CTERM sorting domain-containing protein [Polyangiaceae bacterium]